MSLCQGRNRPLGASGAQSCFAVRVCAPRRCAGASGCPGRRLSPWGGEELFCSFLGALTPLFPAAAVIFVAAAFTPRSQALPRQVPYGLCLPSGSTLGSGWQPPQQTRCEELRSARDRRLCRSAQHGGSPGSGAAALLADVVLVARGAVSPCSFFTPAWGAGPCPPSQPGTRRRQLPAAGSPGPPCPLGVGLGSCCLIQKTVNVAPEPATPGGNKKPGAAPQAERRAGCPCVRPGTAWPLRTGAPAPGAALGSPRREALLWSTTRCWGSGWTWRGPRGAGTSAAAGAGF